METALDRAEAIIRLMRELETVLCSSCAHCIACAGRVDQACQIRYADQARVMCGGEIDGNR